MMWIDLKMASVERSKLVTTSEVNEIINNAVPENTKKATKFAVKIFKEWLSQQTEFSTQLEEMEKADLAKCLEKFYLGARQKDGFFYKANTLRSIRAGLDRYLQSPEIKKPFSIITDPEFLQANKALDAFVKTLRKHGEIGEVVHKGALTPEIVEKLFQSGQLGPYDSRDPTQLQNTVWFYISIYFGKRGRFSLSENQRKMTKQLLVLRTTRSGRQFFEINRSLAGALTHMISHQGFVKSVEEEWSTTKMFDCPGSPRCPVETVKNYLLHLHPAAEFFFQKPRALNGAKFNPPVDQIWYCNAPLGDRSLGEMMKKMTSRAGIYPYLTNYCIRATCVEVLGYENVEASLSTPVTLSIAEAAKSVPMDESESDTCTNSSPVNVWMPESIELFKKLTSDLMDDGNGDWIKQTDDLSSSSFNGEKRLFTKAVSSEFPGKLFEYQFFLNKNKQRLKGVVQFGPYTQGPSGCVHRGASTSMLDAAFSVCVDRCFSHCIAASLSMDYKSFLPLGSTALVESRVNKVEGKVIFCSAELKSPDCKVTFVTANALFIQLDTRGQASSSARAEENTQTRGLNASNVQTSTDDGFSGNSADTTERKMRLRSTILQQLKDLKALKDDGVLLESEFVSQKEKLLRELNSL